jgi:hypothetical protein
MKVNWLWVLLGCLGLFFFSSGCLLLDQLQGVLTDVNVCQECPDPEDACIDWIVDDWAP